MRIAYSYIRFSTVEQRLGDSKRRQLEASEVYAKAHGLVLDQEFRLVDEGKSAFRGAHRREGALRLFLEAVKNGKVIAGSVLIVESLDRLSREKITDALTLFMEIINAGIEVVTLMDGQHYSKASLDQGPGGLFISLVVMWRAHEESVTKSGRGLAWWEQRRKRAFALKEAIPGHCPAWLRRGRDGRWQPIPDRVKLVKVIYWLSLRGWGQKRIGKLFNRCKVPPWGCAKRRTVWNYGYVHKLLTTRAVIGEFLPHTTRGGADGVGVPVQYGERRPALREPIKGYFPAIIDEATFARAQSRARGPCGPVGRRVSNLFQGLLRDGEHPECPMHYRDHGNDRWIYVVSDFCRRNPDAPIFSWHYPKLERLILGYLRDLDWSSLTSERDAALKELSDKVVLAEGRLRELEERIGRLLEVATSAAGRIDEVVQAMLIADQERATLRAEVAKLKVDLAGKQGLSAEDLVGQIRCLAANGSLEARLQLRGEIRRQVERIELFRAVPNSLLPERDLSNSKPDLKMKEMLSGKCLRIVFRNGAERWVFDGADPGLRYDGVKVPEPNHVIVDRDDLGGKVLLDERMASSRKGNPVKQQERERKRKGKEGDDLT
jgi:DNA invertase Pin-like site-specific DNA recombinase